jgi:cytoskeletal protein RodZ
MEKNLQTIIEEALEQKSLNYEKLADLTGIPEKYIISLQSQELKKLPAYPYIRGYLKKICDVLGLNFEESWKIYQKELSHKKSGAFDKLPANRFAIKKINKKNVAIGIVAAILLAFFALNFNNFFGKPYLEITNPKDSLSTVSTSSINVIGKINPTDKLTINSKDIVTDLNGSFESTYELQPGLNTIEFKVKKLLGKENSQIKQIILETSPVLQNENTGAPAF